MSQSAVTLLVAAAALFAVGLFALTHRRDALGATLAAVLGFDAVACALVGFADIASTRAEAAQLQSFAVLVQVVGALWVAAGVSMAALLRRRTGGSDLLELAAVARQPQVGAEPGGDEGEPDEPTAEADGQPPEATVVDPPAEVAEEG